MRAEAVVLDDSAPVNVDLSRTLFGRADSVLPVVLVGEAAAGPAQVRDVDFAQGRNDVVAHTPRVGDRRVEADPQPVIDTAAEVLSEMTIDVTADFRA